MSPPGAVDASGDRPKSKDKGIARGRRAASADVMTNYFSDQADTLSSSSCAQTEVILVTFVIPFFSSPLQKLCWAVAARLWTALSFVNQMNVCVRAELLEGVCAAAASRVGLYVPAHFAFSSYA